MALKFTWNDSGSPLGVFFKRRFLVILALGFASGLPLALSASTLFVWLREAGVDLAAIGLFAALGTPYTLKFLWSPLVDHLRLPILTRAFGRRRGWMLLSQALLVLSIFALGQSEPAVNAFATALAAFLVAFFSATQDIVIDAFRIETFEKREQAAAAAVQVYGYRVGMLASGAGALYIASGQSWGVTYAAMAALVLIGSLAAVFAKEPQAPAAVPEKPKEARDWVKRAVIDPFADFMTRKGWAVVLLFIVLYKFGDALAGVMTNPFLIDLGFTKIEIANIAKLFGFAATLFGLGAGGVLMARAGLFKSLLLCGILQLLSNLMFVAQALAGHNLELLAATIAFENFAGGMGTAVFVAYLSLLCNVRYTATQYALFSSLFAFSRTWLSASSGFLADVFGWAAFFAATTLAAVPALLLLLWLKRIDARAAEKRVFS